MKQKTYLSGVRASGRLHIGNLIGAVRRFAKFQEDPGARCLYFIADYHALTTEGSGDVAQHTHEIALDFLAAGVDPERSSIYVQSAVPAIAELALLLGMLQPLGEIMATPTFKDKAKGNPQSVSMGLINYPVLMAADILGVAATHVPVGKDQLPHIELARAIVQKVNRKVGRHLLPLPEALAADILVPGLTGGKMGKSESAGSVPLTASAEEITSLYRRQAITDPARARRDDLGDPDACVAVYPMYRLIAAEADQREVAASCRSGARGCVDCKTEIAERLYRDVVGPFQEARAKLARDPSYVRDVLREGARDAGETVAEIVAAVREAFKLAPA